MADTPLSWDHVHTVLAVLEEGSLSAAARALGLAQPTVGRHVETLEQALGTTLFTRSRHGLRPTASALALRPHAEALRSNGQALQRAVAGVADDVAGPVRVTAAEIVCGEVLPPIVAALLRRQPRLQIELVASNRVQDLLQRDADIAVRMTAPRQEALLARHLGEVTVQLHAHPDYLRARGEPATLEALRGHTLIGYDTETDYIRRLRREGVPVGRERFSLRTDNDLAALAALRAGCGIGYCHRQLARRTPRLQPLLGAELVLQLPVWVVMHEDLRSSRRCRVVFDALADGLRTYLDADDDA